MNRILLQESDDPTDLCTRLEHSTLLFLLFAACERSLVESTDVTPADHAQEAAQGNSA